MDPFTFMAFTPECDLHPLSPSGWKWELERSRPDMLFVESAWQGKDDLWGSGRLAKGDEILGIIEWCRQRKIPTVFWNKEDPVHFTTFLNMSALFDHIFTTDLDAILRYKAAHGHDRVYLLPFANQPRMFGPIESEWRIPAFGFAGAYYTRYPERASDLRSMVDELIKLHPFLIWDRNYGSEDERYSFPRDYRAFIVGSLPLDQVHHAYKGYLYAVNLNSVKQSQTMMARRVFELLGSNNLVVSNFARSVRVLFGDLVMASDDPEALSARIREFKATPVKARKHRLAGVRKVMKSHTYRDRFSYVWEKVSGAVSPDYLPDILVVSRVSTREQSLSVLAHYQRQNYEKKRLLLIEDTENSDYPTYPDSVSVLSGASSENFDAGMTDFVAPMSNDDFYGPNYLLDLALGTTYSDSSVLGKAAYFAADRSGQIKLNYGGSEYRPSRSLALRRSLVQIVRMQGREIARWSNEIANSEILGDGLSIDEFNYCENGRTTGQAPQVVSDLEGLDSGVQPIRLRTLSESVAVSSGPRTHAYAVDANHFYTWFAGRDQSWCSIALEENGCRIVAKLPEREFKYLWTGKFPADEVLTTSPQPLFLDAGQGLDLRFALRFLDENEAIIGSSVVVPYEPSEIVWPPQTRWVVPGLRLAGSGEALVSGIYSADPEFGTSVLVPRGSHLVVTNIYPDPGALYRNAFVHRRLLGYRERGVSVEVLRFRSDSPLRFSEFEGVDVTTGSERVLGAMLNHGAHESVMVHFLEESMWAPLRNGVGGRRLTIFVHGFEIQSLRRRIFDDEPEDRMKTLAELSDRRTSFWRRVFGELPKNAHVVFVSQYLADQVMEDLGVAIPSESYSVIHNPIDTQLFEYRPKTPDQRLKVLSIRPFTSRIYANDLSVEAILRLSEEPWFNQLQICLVGEGKLFDEVVAPLRGFPNVVLDNRFLRQSEISELHKEYGIFLCPTRMDTHGVSRDEAMASGLVPITSATAAVPEFVDESCGFMAPPESSDGLADAIRVLFNDPQRFERMSEAAAARVRSQAAFERTVPQELALMGIGDSVESALD